MNAEEKTEYCGVFDVIAELIGYLKTLDPHAYASKDARRSMDPPKDLEEAVGQLFRAHDCLRDEMGLVCQGIPAGVVEELRAWAHYGSFSHMLEFLSRLTRQMRGETIVEYAEPVVQRREGFCALNGNWEDTGILVLPKVRSIHDSLTPAEETNEDVEGGAKTGCVKKHWATDRLAGLNGELNGIYYVEAEKLTVNGELFLVRHHVVRNSFFLENREELRIGFSPISQGDFLTVETGTREEAGVLHNCFEVTGLKNKELLQERIRAAILEACAQGVDILMFPEMLGSEEILAPDFFRAIEEMAEERGLPMPALILWPTWWHERSNELYVVDGSGERVCIQQKQYPFLFPWKERKKEYIERLEFCARVIHVVHVPGLGRLTFPICRDYLEPDYLTYLTKELRSTFLFCPSYSGGKTQFDLTAPGQVQYGCYTVWGNTCAANSDPEQCPDYVGLISGPAAEEEYIKRLRPQCGGRCGAQSDACLFVVRVRMDHSARISWEHICPDGENE